MTSNIPTVPWVMRAGNGVFVTW